MALLSENPPGCLQDSLEQVAIASTSGSQRIKDNTLYANKLLWTSCFNLTSYRLVCMPPKQWLTNSVEWIVTQVHYCTVLVG